MFFLVGLTKVHIVKHDYGFPSSPVQMWELDHKESWAPKNSFLTIVLEKTLESPLDCKEIKAVNLKGNQFWITTRRTDAEAEAPILWPPDVKSWLIGKDPDSGKHWRSIKNDRGWDGWWHHQLNGHEVEQILGVGNAQWSLVCCSPWGRRVRHDWVTESRTNLRDLVEFARRCSFLEAEQGNVTRGFLSQLSLTQVCFLLFFSCSVMSDSLQHHGWQHARLPCPSPSPRICLNSFPLSQWCCPHL